MTRRRALAAAQTIPHRGDIDANVAEHCRFVRAAAEAGAGTVVFPELSLTGYELDLASELAFSEDDPRLAPLIQLASTRRMTLIVGAPVRLGTRLHIGAFILSPDHSVGLYTKRHLGAGEEALVHPGSRDPVVAVGSTTGAVAVCADANRPSHARKAADRGVGSYLVSTFVTPSELTKKTANLRIYAIRHAMTVVFANYGGPSGGLPSGGRSAIWSEEGEVLAQMEGLGAGLVVAVEDDAGWRAGSIALSDA
jgi:predicted amidohydrolase